MLTRKIAKISILGSLVTLGGYVAFVIAHVPECNPSDQITTSGDAIEFAKYWLRRDDQLPFQLGLASIDAIDEKLSVPDCCEAQALDPEANSSQAWKVVIKASKPERFDLLYSVAFSACRRSIIENRQIRKFPAAPLENAQ